MDVDRILQLDNLAGEEIKKYKKRRFIYSTLKTTEGRPFVAIIGPRGVGKTIILRQMRNTCENGLYISADTLSSETSLAEIVHYFSANMGITDFFIDEIHFTKKYAADLKELYDFTSANIWFSSSVALSLHTSVWDLSRRVQTVYLLPFSIREYLFFRYNKYTDPLSVQSALFKPLSSEYLRGIQYFDEYMKGALYPFLLEPGATFEQFPQIIKKIIHNDIPNFEPQLTIEDISLIEKTLTFIGKSPIDGINYSSISRNIGITKYKAEKYLSLLEKSFLVKQVFPKGTNVLREPKVFIELPYRLAYREYEACIGELREDFFALAALQHGIDFSYVKTTRGKKTPDFIVEIEDKNVVIEIGGPGKGRTQFKGVSYDQKIVLFHSTSGRQKDFRPNPGSFVPLHCLGFA